MMARAAGSGYPLALILLLAHGHAATAPDLSGVFTSNTPGRQSKDGTPAADESHTAISHML